MLFFLLPGYGIDSHNILIGHSPAGAGTSDTQSDRSVAVGRHRVVRHLLSPRRYARRPAVDVDAGFSLLVLDYGVPGHHPHHVSDPRLRPGFEATAQDFNTTEEIVISNENRREKPCFCGK